MRVDWQAYEAGLLSAEENARIEALLAADPAARAELEGLRRLRGSLAAVQAVEPVPLQSLHARMVANRARPKMRPWMTGLAAAVILTAVGAVSVGVFRSVSDPKSGTWTKAVSRPEEAKSFARLHSDIRVSDLDPAPLATITSVSCGRTWVKYGLDYHGKPAEMSVMNVPKKVFRVQCVVRNGVKFYLADTFGSTSVVWRQNDFEFSLTGLTKTDMWPLTDALQSKTANWPVAR